MLHLIERYPFAEFKIDDQTTGDLTNGKNNNAEQKLYSQARTILHYLPDEVDQVLQKPAIA